MTVESGPVWTVRPRRLKWQGVAGIAVALSLLAACGSSGNSSSDTTSGGAATTAAGAETTAAGAETTTAGSGGARPVAAQRNATPREQADPPRSVSRPLKTKPEASSLRRFQCDVNHARTGDALEATRHRLGLRLQLPVGRSRQPGRGDEAGAAGQADRRRPSGLPPAVWQTVLRTTSPRHPIVTGHIGTIPYDDTIIGQVGSSPDVDNGERSPTAVRLDGKANVLLQSVNDFRSSIFSTRSSRRPLRLRTARSPRSTTPSPSDGRRPSIVSAVQDPSIKYVVTVNGPSSPAAVALGAELTTSIAESGDVTNLTNVKAGKESAFTALALHYGSYSMIDMVLRHLQDLKFDPDGNAASSQLLTKDVDFEISNSYDKPTDFADQFKKLWLADDRRRPRAGPPGCWSRQDLRRGARPQGRRSDHPAR
jgi:hypothetical protein